MAKVRSPVAMRQRQVRQPASLQPLLRNRGIDVPAKDIPTSTKDLSLQGRKVKQGKYVRRARREIDGDDRNVVDLSEEFDSTLEQSRCAIGDQTSSALDSIEHELLIKLDDLVAVSDEGLRAAKAWQDDLFMPLDMEKLSILRQGKISETHPMNREKIQLGARMDEFQGIVLNAEKTLETLWSEWSSVQQQIVALGVDVFGPDCLDFDSIKDEQALREILQSSIGAFHRREEEAAAATQHIHRLHDQIKQTTEGTILSSRAQEKAFTARKQDTTKKFTEYLHSVIENEG